MRAPFLALALAAACGGLPPDDGLSTVELALAQAPADAACIRVKASAAGRALVVNIGYTPGESTVAHLTGVPEGEVVFSADAFAIDCAQLLPATPRSWFAAPVIAQVPASGALALKLTFYR